MWGLPDRAAAPVRGSAPVVAGAERRINRPIDSQTSVASGQTNGMMPMPMNPWIWSS